LRARLADGWAWGSRVLQPAKIALFATDRRICGSTFNVSGLTLLVMLALAIGIVVAWRAGIARGKREAETAGLAPMPPAAILAPHARAPEPLSATAGVPSAAVDAAASEQSRLIRSLESENATLRRAAAAAAEAREVTYAEESRRQLVECEHARAETARYREIVVDLENNALPPLLDGPNMFDDLKLIVGVGPVLERMLHRLGVATYRQIAHWSERDIDEIDAKLPEFPGRIRRDGWVTQARELHQSKYGETLPAR
jgi:predicted flap endonuclease-1-like 5' DNA nuclease